MAGIQTGDVILSINGTEVAKEGYRKSVQKLSGEPDSVVDLKIMRPGEVEARDFTVRRTVFEPQTVNYHMAVSYTHLDVYKRQVPV